MKASNLEIQVTRARKALQAAKTKAVHALATFKTARQSARELKRQYKEARKLAKRARKLAIQAEESAQLHQCQLAKAQKKLLKNRKSAKKPDRARVRALARSRTAPEAASREAKPRPGAVPTKVALPGRIAPAASRPRVAP